MESAPWKINLFGRLSAHRGERVITNFKTQKTAILLACLAQEPNRAIRREDLVERLWPEEPAEITQNRLRVVLSYLRKLLETAPEDHGKILLADRRDVRLAPDFVTTDALEFEAALIRADRSRADAERIEALEKAVAQYQSNFLVEFDEYWILMERIRLEDAYQLALRRLIQALMNLRKHDRALAVAQKAVQADPYREETHRLLMQLYAKLGRPTAALRQYEELQALLENRTGSAPSVETRDMLAKVWKPQQAPEVRADEPVRPAVPKPRSKRFITRVAAPRFPAPLTPMIGREDALTQVMAMVDTPETRLVNLIGVGGVGKTRLALAAAALVRSQGRLVCYLPLTGLTDANDIPHRLAAAFDIPLRPRAELWSRLIDALYEQPLLLVLDNVEHLLPMAGPVIRSLLEELPNLSCLTTSRQRLGVAAEYPYTVRPLSTPAPQDDLARLEEVPSVRLWLDRVRNVAPDFRLTESNCRDVASLCRTLEGIPLALELAAAWSDVLAPRQIAARLHARFDVLVGRDSRFDGRHASLRTALDWSFDQLGPIAQRFFAMLGRFQSGWTLEAAEAVCGEPEALKWLAQLCERSLVITQETESGIRYSFLTTIREYARLRLRADGLVETNRRYCDFYLALAEEAAAALKTSESPVWMQCLKTEEENFRSALALALEDTLRPDLPLEMSVALYRYWYIDGAVSEGRRWISSALVLSDSPLRPKALTALGNLAYAQGDIDYAEQCYSETRRIYERLGDEEGLAKSLGNLSIVYRSHGDLENARALAFECLTILKRLDDPRGVALTLGNLSRMAFQSDDFSAALAYSEEALALFQKLGDPQSQITVLINMNNTLNGLGHLDRCAALLKECVDLCVRLGSRRQLGIVFYGISAFCKRAGKNAAAIQIRAAADELWRLLEVIPPPEMAEELDQDLAEMQQLLDDAAFQDEWNQGLRLTEEEAISFATQCLTPT